MKLIYACEKQTSQNFLSVKQKTKYGIASDIVFAEHSPIKLFFETYFMQFVKLEISTEILRWKIKNQEILENTAKKLPCFIVQLRRAPPNFCSEVRRNKTIEIALLH